MRDKYQKNKKQKLKEPLYNCYLTPTEDKNKKNIVFRWKSNPTKIHIPDLVNGGWSQYHQVLQKSLTTVREVDRDAKHVSTFSADPRCSPVIWTV